MQWTRAQFGSFKYSDWAEFCFKARFFNDEASGLPIWHSDLAKESSTQDSYTKEEFVKEILSTVSLCRLKLY